MGTLKKLRTEEQQTSGGGKLVKIATTGAGTQNASLPLVTSNVNAALSHSGLTRDAFDSQVRKNYAAAQKTGAPVLTGSYGGGGGRGGLPQEQIKAGVERAERGKKFSGTAGVFSAPKLVGGALLKGTDQAMSGLASTADWLVGQNITGAGKLLGQDWSNNPISALNQRLQQAKTTNENYFAGNVRAGGKAAAAVDKYGTMTAAAIPQALLAMATAGGSAVEQGLQAAANSGGVLTTLGTAVKSMAKDPQYWLSFLQVAGDSYKQAKEDGASDTQANLYAMSNGMLNALVEVGGDTGHGGIQDLPKQMRAGGSTLKSWISSMVDEGKEEVIQGIIERGLQRVVYQKENAAFSTRDENAILNPKTAAQEFAGGAIVGGILGGGQILGAKAANAISDDITPKLKTAEELGLQNEKAATEVTEKPTEAVQLPADIIAQQEKNVAASKKALETQRAIHRNLYAEFRSTDAETRRPELLDEAMKNKGALAQAERDLKIAQNQLLRLKKRQEQNVLAREAKAKAIAEEAKKEVQTREAREGAARKEAQAAAIASRFNGRFLTDEAIQDIEKTGAFPQKTAALKAAYEEAKNTQSQISSLWTQLNQADSLEDSIRLKKEIDRKTARLDGLANAIKTAQKGMLQPVETGVKHDAITSTENQSYLDSLATDQNAPKRMTAKDYARRTEDARLKKMEAPPETQTEPISRQDEEELGILLNGGRKAEKTTVPTEKAFSQPGTKNAMGKLKIQIDGDMGDYRNTEFLRESEKARKKTQRAIREAERRLDPTAAEKTFAKGISGGIYSAEDIPATMNRATVQELADYYGADTKQSGVQRQKARIRDQADQLAEQFFKDADKYKPISMLKMNERTPERVMRSTFGDSLGEEINNAYIYPVQTNEAEKVRFINRMLDTVRTFEGSDGKSSPLTKEERAVVQQVMEDRFVPETVASMEMSGNIRSAAENITNGEDARDAAKEFSLTREEKELAEQLSRWTQNQKLLESGNLDQTKINNAAKTYADQFNLFYDAINDFLVAHGYEPIGFIKGYAPHMQGADTQNRLLSALKSLGANTDASELPTAISGLTADFAPVKRWDPYFLSRTGTKTDYDIAKAYESYVSHLSDVLYHTDDIARLRGAERYLRRTFGSEEQANAIDHAEAIRNAKPETIETLLRDAGKIKGNTKLSPEDTQARLDEYIDGLYDGIRNMKKYGELVKYIHNYANILAGKQSEADRGMEYAAGRKSLNWGNKVLSAFGRAQVAGNVSSVLNQSAQLSQILAEVKGEYVAKAASDLTKSTGGRIWNIKKTELFNQSDLLTGKKGIEYLTADDSIIDRYTSALFKPADIMDSLVSALAVQSKYNQEIDRGKAPDAAMLAANKFATEVMGSRMKGSRPLSFESKNPLSQMLHMFQVEALNSWEHVSQDLPARYRGIANQYGKKAAARAVATVATRGLISAFVLNRITEAVYGGSPAPFDLLGYISNFIASGYGMSTNAWLKDLLNTGWKKAFGTALFSDPDDDKDKKEFQWGKAFEDLGYNIMNDVPFLRNLAGLAGLGDQSMPLTNIADSVKGVAQAVKNGAKPGETLSAGVDFLAQIAPGGRQLQKTVQGIQTITNGGRVYGYGDNKRLQYPVSLNPMKGAQLLAFGNSGVSESRDFYAGDQKGLTQRQTQLVQSMAADGANRREVYQTIQQIREGKTTTEKMQALNRAELSDLKKLKIYSGAIASGDSGVSEKFQNLMGKGLKWDQITGAYTTYLKLKDDDNMSASEKATRFAKWADDAGLDAGQRAAVKDSLAFYAQSRAEAGRYDHFTSSGLKPAVAEDLSLRLSQIKPEKGKDQVTDLQRYQTVVSYGLKVKDQMAALKTMMEDTEYEKLKTAYDAGISPKEYVGFKQATSGISADQDSGGKTISGSKKKKILQAIDEMDLNRDQKTALYYAAGYKEITLDEAPWYWDVMPKVSGGTGKGMLTKVIR